MFLKKIYKKFIRATIMILGSTQKLPSLLPQKACLRNWGSTPFLDPLAAPTVSYIDKKSLVKREGCLLITSKSGFVSGVVDEHG
jgi:hypothetical protein